MSTPTMIQSNSALRSISQTGDRRTLRATRNLNVVGCLFRASNRPLEVASGGTNENYTTLALGWPVMNLPPESPCGAEYTAIISIPPAGHRRPVTVNGF